MVKAVRSVSACSLPSPPQVKEYPWRSAKICFFNFQACTNFSEGDVVKRPSDCLPLGPQVSLSSRNYLQFLSKDLFSSPVFGNNNIVSLCFLSFWLFWRTPRRMIFLDLIKSHLTKMPFINSFSSSPPGLYGHLHSPGPKSFKLELLSPSSPLGALYFYFSSFMGVSLSN